MKIILVCTDLICGDRLFVEKAVDRLSPRAHSRDIDPSTLVAKVAVRLRDVRQPVGAQHLSHARCILLVHLVDAECEVHVDLLFPGQLSENGMFGRAGTTALLEHEPKFPAIGDSPIGQCQDMASCPDEVVDSSRQKQRSERTARRERPIRELLKRVRHGVAPPM